MLNVTEFQFSQVIPSKLMIGEIRGSEKGIQGNLNYYKQYE